MWQPWAPYPIPVGEGQGLVLMKTVFVILSGFTQVFSNVTTKGWSYNTTNALAKWTPVDDIPLTLGLSHTAFTRVGENAVAMCGGYVGPHPGRATEKCLLFVLTNTPGSQWTYLPDLPGQRSGGALFHDMNTNTLTYATGADRPDPNPIHTYDHNDVWILNMSNQSSGWMNTTKIPYKRNHVGSTTVKYRGVQRHFATGGQKGELESWENTNEMFEWDLTNRLWLNRTKMPEARGHFSSSTMPYSGCGFFIAGGRLNGPLTPDVSYYDITTNSWTSMGNLTLALNTPICDVAGNFIWCNTGRVGNTFAWRVEILTGGV
jgi:hypothetical protein